jgi:hypothetical protein
LKPKQSNPLLRNVGPPLTEEKVSNPKNHNNKDDSNENEKDTYTTIPTGTTLSPLLDWNASGSIGSLLMQMQRKEEEMRKLNKTLLDKEQALDLSLNATTATTSSSSSSKRSGIDDNNVSYSDEERAEKEKEQKVKDDLFSWMLPKQEDTDMVDDDGAGTGTIDMDMAKELDEAVSIRITTSTKDFTFLELPELYKILTTPTGETIDEEKNEEDLPPLSRPEHYEGRIGRDMRHLAVSIASCVDDISEWRLFCQQATGGIMPLIQCIRDGASSIRNENKRPSSSSKSSLVRPENYSLSPNGSVGMSIKEENFLIASSACCALRDLCALSQDMAAVITDGLLRANSAYGKTGDLTLMDDMCTLLRHADDMSDLSSKTRKRSKLHVTQLLLAMTCASDIAVDAIRSTDGLQNILLQYSSYARKQRRRRWLRYPGEMIKSMWLARRTKSSMKAQATAAKRSRPFIEATSLKNDLDGRIQGTVNQVLAAIGYNEWVPKIPGQKGLRILCLDGGGSRGMTSVMAMKCLVDSLGGLEVADCFDMVVGTSTGAIIAFLVGLNRETSEQAVARYDVLIEKIFTKSAFSTPMLLFTTASYDELPFMKVLSEILGDNTMLDARANPAVPFVFAVTSKMSSTPTHVTLFRN